MGREKELDLYCGIYECTNSIQIARSPRGEGLVKNRTKTNNIYGKEREGIHTN